MHPVEDCLRLNLMIDRSPMLTSISFQDRVTVHNHGKEHTFCIGKESRGDTHLALWIGRPRADAPQRLLRRP
jgi:hypothetical protein